jgi:signal transduction histidine kinase
MTLADLPDQVREPLRKVLQRNQGERPKEVTLRRSNVVSLFLSLSATPLRGPKEEPTGAVAVLHDITELKHLEAELRRAERLATVGTLAAGIAHEIRNPLVSLKTFSQLLPAKYDDPEFRHSFSQIAVCEIDRINALVEQLLNFARPPKPIAIPLDIHEPLERTLSLLATELSKGGITTLRRYHPAPLLVHGDSEQLKQVFMNVLLNSVEALGSRGGGVIQVVTSTRRRPTWTPEGPPPAPPGGFVLTDLEVVVEISDNGPGIRESHLKHVFDPFFTTKDTGHGLGLSIAHGIIREHKGTINAANRPGGGALFTIALPLIEREEARRDGRTHELCAGHVA